MKYRILALSLLALIRIGAATECSSSQTTNCFHTLTAANLTNINFTPTPGNVRVDFQDKGNLLKNFYFAAGSDLESARSMLAILLTAKQKGLSVSAYVQYSGSSGWIGDNYNAAYYNLTLIDP